MAQGNSQELDSVNNEEDSKDVLECPVCLQSCIHPARLPCGHIFCFLCVKGVANQSKRCALCRAEIPVDFLDHPYLVPNYEETEVAHNGYQWFYEGRNGWWQYDERTSIELEASFTKREKTCELLIAGFLYLIDFETMMQIRRNDPRRKRQIKRDVSTIPKKGVAGIRIEGCGNTDNTEYNEEMHSTDESNHEIPTENILAQYPELVETNIAYQNLDQSNISEGVLDESDFSDNDNVDNTQSIRISSVEPADLSNESVESHEFENFILNRIRAMNLMESNNSESE